VLPHENPFSGISQFQKMLESMTATSKLLRDSPLEQFRINAIKFDQLVTAGVRDFDQLVNVQENLGRSIANSLSNQLLADSVAVAALNANLDRSLNFGFTERLSKMFSESYLNAFNSLGTQLRCFGIFESSDDSDDMDVEISELPDDTTSTGIHSDATEICERLEIVRFLPFRLLKAILGHPNLMKKISPREFEELVAELLHQHDFENIILTPRSGDGGRDVIATQRCAGIPVLFAFECKRYQKKVGIETMRTLLGTVTHTRTKANVGVLATTSELTKGAKKFILHEPSIKAHEFNDLVKLLEDIKHKIQ